MWRSGDSPENKNHHRVEMRMIKKSSLSGHAESIMSNKAHYLHEHPCEEMLKVIDGRDMRDVTEDKFSY